MEDEPSGQYESEPGAQIVEDPPEELVPAAGAIEEKQDAGLMVYMTPTERAAFKRWAFDNDLSMSKAAGKMIAERMAAPESGLDAAQVEPPSVQAEYTPATGQGRLQEKAAALANASADLAEALWVELEQGARLPDLAEATGLPVDQIQYLLRVGTPPAIA